MSASDDSGCGYYPRDLMCPSAAMRTRVVDEDEDEAGDSACCSMDLVYPIEDLIGRGEDGLSRCIAVDNFLPLEFPVQTNTNRSF